MADVDADVDADAHVGGDYGNGVNEPFFRLSIIESRR